MCLCGVSTYRCRLHCLNHLRPFRPQLTALLHLTGILMTLSQLSASMVLLKMILSVECKTLQPHPSARYHRSKHFPPYNSNAAFPKTNTKLNLHLPPSDPRRVLVLPGRGGLPAHRLPVGGLDVLEVLCRGSVVHLFHRAIEDHQRVPAPSYGARSTHATRIAP